MCVLLLNYTNNAHATSTVATQPTILILGDSISAAYGIDTEQGWVALLQSKVTTMGMKYRIINASVSGDTTRTGLNRLKPLLIKHQPEIVIVALGGNDGLRGLPFTEISASLSKIITLSQQFKATVLLVGVRLPPNYGAAYNKRFTSIFKQLTKKFKISFVPSLLANVDEQTELMQSDKIHPKATAQPQLLQNVWLKLETIIKK